MLLRRLRGARDLTIERLAERSGVTPQTIGMLERGEHRAPQAGTAKRLADGLGLTGSDRDEFLGTAEAQARSARQAAPSATPTPGGSGTCAVFISYAQDPDLKAAEAIHHALRSAGLGVYLDTERLAVGEVIAAGVLEAVLDARVVVVLAGRTYFTRRYCLEELAMALGPFQELRRRAASRDLLDDALLPLVVALPAKPVQEADWGTLPHDVRAIKWPTTKAGDLAALTALVVERSAACPHSIRERYAHLGLRADVASRAEAIALPEPLSLGATRVYPDTGPPPSIGEELVGRGGELWELHAALAQPAPGQAAPTVVLEGGGGFGKTRLALEYVHRHGPTWFPGGLFWLPAAATPDQMEPQHHGLLRMLRPEVPDLRAFRAAGRSAPAELGEALRAEVARRPALVVLDDLPEAERITGLSDLARWCPAVGQVALLVTSRGRWAMASGVKRIPVRELARQAAVRLLRRGLEAGPGVSDDDWETVARWVGDLPLALELLNAVLRSGAAPPSALVAAARDDGPIERVDRWVRALDAPRLRGVAQAFEVSYRRLPVGARRAARLIACLAPAPIPARLAAREDGGLLTAAERALLGTRSFVIDVGVEQGAVATYGRMHPLLADYLRTVRPRRASELRRARDALLGAMAPADCRDPASWPLLTACLPHAEAVFERLGEEGPAGEQLAQLGLVIGLLLREQGDHAAAETWALRAEAAATELGPDHPQSLRASESVAAALHDQGRLAEAMPRQLQVMEARRRRFGAGHPDTLRAKGNLAAMLYDRGELVPARQLEEEVLEATRRSRGEEHEDTLWAMGCLAATLHALGELDGARKLEERVLRVRGPRLGGEHPDTLRTMESLAAVLFDQGDRERARALQAQVLEARTRLLGATHPATLRAERVLRDGFGGPMPVPER